VAFLVTGKKLSADDACMSCSLAADLHVTQAVDATKGVHAKLAKSLFRWRRAFVEVACAQIPPGRRTPECADPATSGDPVPDSGRNRPGSPFALPRAWPVLGCPHGR